MTTFYFIRHGLVDNPRDIYYGRLPGYPLSAEGKEAIKFTAQALRHHLKGRPVIIYNSPLLRTQQTADILAKTFKSSPQSDDRLLEVATLFEGKAMGSYHAMQYPEVKAGYMETMEDIYARMAHFLREKATQHPDQHVLAITHGGPIRVLELGLTNQPFDVSTYRQTEVPVCGSGLKVTVDGDSITVVGQVLDGEV